MAIYIVDQFSLNTDLPLDIRYVPNGGTYFDVSGYWYPGMQVYQTSDQKIWYADNSLNWHMVGQGADASLNALYQFFNDLSTYVYQQIPAINASITTINGSINNIYANIQIINASIATLDSSIKDLYKWQLIQDASIVALRNTDISLDASIQLLNAWQLSQDASINALRSKDASLDASLNYLWGWQYSQDASIELLRLKDASLDASINYLYNWNTNQDTSISTLNGLISGLDSCLGNYVKKAGDTMSGALTISAGGLQVTNDVSILGKLYVAGNTAIGGDLTINGSLYVINTGTLDVSTGFIRLNTGLTGTPPITMQSGIVFERGSAEPYVILYDETDKTFRIGVASETSTGYLDASTQAVATREDSPVVNGIAVWNDTLNRFDTSLGLTFDNQILRVDASLTFSKYASGNDVILVVSPNGTVKVIPTYDGSINALYAQNAQQDASIIRIDGSINKLFQQNITQDASIITLDSSVKALFTRVNTIDSSITYLNSSINQLFARKDTSVLGAMNIGDSSAQIYAGLSVDGSLQFKGFVSSSPSVIISQTGDLIIIGIDASSGGEVNTASNIPGSDASIFSSKVAQDLRFKGLKSLDPSMLIITSDASFVYIDLSIGSVNVNASLGGLTDVSLSAPLLTHQIVEYDASLAKWKNTNNIYWDLSLGTTTDDLGGIPQGTNLNNLTLKQILYKILYEYQIPTLLTGTNPVSGIFEKGLVSTQFASIDVSWYATNVNYPLALLNNVHISKTGIPGSIFDASLGLVATNASTYTDATGITNWGGLNRTISYNVTIDDDQSNKPQPAIGLSKSFTFYYRQFWGEVPGTTTAATVDSSMILTLDSSRLAGETDLTGTFTYTGGPKIKYLFAYPDTPAAPDNFNVLSQILDQNDFDITGSWDTAQKFIYVGPADPSVRYRFYLLKNKVDTSTFNVTFKF